MSVKWIFVLLIWSTGLSAQPVTHSFQELQEAFEKGYRQLDIPELELSYINNLNNIKSSTELKAHQQFFEHYQNTLQQISTDRFSADEKVTYAVLQYEVDLNLQRIALEMKWKENGYTVSGDRVFEESMGKEWYAYFLQKWVDKGLTPDVAYQFGLGEIEVVKQRMKAIQSELRLDDEAFQAELTASRYYLTDNEKILSQYDALKERVQQQAKAYFPDVDKVPPVTIQAGTYEELAIVPAYYNNDTFFYNFFDEPYDTRDMGWIFMHEAIPGHHYQLSLDAFLDAPVRKLFTYMGYLEGWAAYIEQYGNELSAFNTPLDGYKQLQWDLIRSVRVALDVGLNYYGWTDEQAFTFWKQHIPNDDAVAWREIKRMKRWPAQVITYKYGKHVLDELKGEKTSPQELKPFHQSVLEFGTIPLSVLQQHLRSQEG